jgi:polysaccharide biosynthesis transport protein
LHRLFATSGQVGLASVIAKEVEIQDAVQDTAIANLWLLPSGRIPPDPAELLTSPRFSELLAVVREKYDYVLIDSPAVLAVTDPAIVAPRVDAVLLALHLSKDSRQHTERAHALLSAMGVNIIGVVVNGVRQVDADYGYGYGHDVHYENDHLHSLKERTERGQTVGVSQGRLGE